jgi:hypothetical protein
MISEIQKIDEGKKVSSRSLRDLSDKTYGRISKTFHDSMKTSGNLRAATICMEMMNASLSSILDLTDPAAANVSLITPYSESIYPSSSFHKAEKTTGGMCFNARRISTRPVFTDTNGNILSSISISRSITAADDVLPDKITENSITNLFNTGIPFITRVEKEVLSRIIMELTISSTDEPLKINALRYVPIPAVGVTTLDNITVNTGGQLTMNGYTVFQSSTGQVMDRTREGYIHFEEVDMADITLTLSSETFLTSYNCVAIGMSGLVGEYNNYALKSYIGWSIPYKGEYTSLTKVKAYAANYSESLSNVRFNLYSNISDFNNVSSSYITTFGSEQILTGINNSLYPNLYLLMEITSVNNTTPCIGKIELEFE